nr:MAG TPA: zinc ribbon domain protein [Caudoviricetes sp.]
MAKKIIQRPAYTCKDCKHATDFHSKALDGHCILCKCPFHEYSKYLTRDYCEHFTKRI